MRIIEDGQIFNYLEIVRELKPIPRTTGGDRRRFLCECLYNNCGNLTKVLMSNLKTVNTCGCLTIEKATSHGLSYHPAYFMWTHMIDRCYNTKSKQYKDYGGRGITVCKGWQKESGLKAFIEWADKNGYCSDLELDRKNNNKGYKPSNCRFVTKQVNLLNKTNTVYVKSGKYKGKSLVEVWKLYGCVVKQNTARERLKRGWDVIEAVTKPL